MVANLTTNAAIFALWIWLYRPVGAYLSTILTRQEFRTNQIVLLAVIGLIVLQSRRGRLSLALNHLPQRQLGGLALALGGSIAFVAAERWLDINTLSATLFGLATYGLLGLWMAPRDWWQGFPAALLLIGVLPFGEHMETFIGYPVRLVTARIASQGLGALGYANIDVDTILIFESGFSQIDSPCSGMKSLWTGGLFLLAATWIERRPVSRRWLLVAVTFIGLLLAANLARVIILVLVGQVAGLRLLAEMLHVPLGVIGFVIACSAAIGLLRWSGDSLAEIASRYPAGPRPRWLAPALVVLLLALILLYAPPPQPAAAAAFEWDFSGDLAVQAWPLTPKEMDWLSAEGSLPVSATRLRFAWRDLRGSLLLIASETWRAHHNPERCFTVYGLQVLESQLHLVNADFPVRWLTLNKAGDQRPLYSAGYWLQSGQRITDDYAVRIWDDLAPQPQPWVLVTVLFDEPVDPAGMDGAELLVVLRQAVQRSLEGKEAER